jgi:hypothetical protein
MRSEYRPPPENCTFQAFENQMISMPLPDADDDIYSIGRQTLITVPYGIKPIGRKWVFKSKRNPDGSARCDVSLVMKCFDQVAGIDFKETYALVSKLATLGLLLSLAATHGWTIN